MVRSYLATIVKIWTVCITTLIIGSRHAETSIPCEFLSGGCEHNFEPSYFFNPFRPFYGGIKYFKEMFVPSPPGTVPRCAKPGLTFCEDIEHYPRNLIKTLVSKTSYLRKFFKDESRAVFNKFMTRIVPDVHGPYSQVQPIKDNDFNQTGNHGYYPDRQYALDESVTHLVDPVLYASYIQPSVDITPYNPSEWWKRNDENGKKRKRRQTFSSPELCPTQTRFIKPKAALSSSGEWKYVVNVDEESAKYTQLVKSETCRTDKCSGLCSLPNGYDSRCEQKFVQKRLVALEGSGRGLYTDIFWFPNCCICEIKPN